MNDKSPLADLPDGMEWVDDPVTVNPQDWLSRMVEADSKPGDSLKRARSNLSYFLKTHPHAPAPRPSPPGHVFTESFFRWLLKKYPGIAGVHPHYGHRLVVSGVTVRWSDAQRPAPPLSPMEQLQQENAALKNRIHALENQLSAVSQENQCWKERDVQRKKACGRRPLTEKINR
jgi:hypothetical protein